jgi:hypothetical protein
MVLSYKDFKNDWTPSGDTAQLELLEDKYNGMTIEYTGIVSKITNNSLFEGINMYQLVNCAIPIDDLDETVKTHMKITIRGTGRIDDNQMLVLEDCEIEKIFTEMDETVTALAFDDVNLEELDMIEITGEISSIDFSAVRLIKDSTTTPVETVYIVFDSKLDLSDFTAGDTVTIRSVWDGASLVGYSITEE